MILWASLEYLVEWLWMFGPAMLVLAFATLLLRILKFRDDENDGDDGEGDEDDERGMEGAIGGGVS